MSGKRIVEIALVTSSSSKSKVHALDPDRYAYTRCGLRDEFEWQWSSFIRGDVSCSRCRKALDALSDHTEGTP